MRDLDSHTGSGLPVRKTHIYCYVAVADGKVIDRSVRSDLVARDREGNGNETHHVFPDNPYPW